MGGQEISGLNLFSGGMCCSVVFRETYLELRMKIVSWLAGCVAMCAALIALHWAINWLVSTHGWIRLSPSDWASWVQAVGSIAALAIAIGIMQNQNKHAGKLVAQADLRATLRKVDSIHAILGRYRNELQQIAGSMQTQPTEHARIVKIALRVHAGLGQVKGMQATIQTIPVFEIGSFDLADATLRFGECVDSCHDYLAKMCVALTPQPSHEQYLKFFSYANSAHDALVTYEEAANILRAQLVK